MENLNDFFKSSVKLMDRG